jgi:hypothetical protein
MVSLSQLLLPIVLGAVAAFIVSSLVHMVIKWHNADYGKLPNEDAARGALRNTPPGQYVTPHCPDPKDLQKPDMQKQFAEGPIALLWIKPNGMGSLPAMLGQWFVLTLAVSTFCAYVAGHVLPPGAAHGTVLRTISTIAFMAYATGSAMDSIWMGKPWSATAKYFGDALLYAFATALPFMWLWPTATDAFKGLFH